MIRLGNHAPRCRFVPRLERLEDRTVLDVTYSSTVYPLVSGSANVAAIELAVYRLGPQEGSVADFTTAISQIATTTNYAGSSPPIPVVIARLSTSPGAQWTWEGPEATAAMPQALFVNSSEGLLEPSLFLLPVAARSPLTVSPALPRVESSWTLVGQRDDSLNARVATAGSTTSTIGVGVTHADFWAVAHVVRPEPYSPEASIVIREPRLDIPPANLTVSQIPVAGAEEESCVFRLASAPRSALSGPAPDVLPFAVTTVRSTPAAPVEEQDAAPVGTATSSLPNAGPKGDSERALPAPIGQESSMLPPGRAEDRENARNATWPPWAAAGGLLVVLYRKAVAPWRRGRREVPSKNWRLRK